MRALYKLFVLFLCMYVVDTVGKNCEFFMKKFSETLTFLRQSVCANKRPFSFLISLNVHILLLPKHDSNILAFFVIIHNFSWSTCQYFVSRNLIHTSSGGTIWDCTFISILYPLWLYLVQLDFSLRTFWPTKKKKSLIIQHILIMYQKYQNTIRNCTYSIHFITYEIHQLTKIQSRHINIYVLGRCNFATMHCIWNWNSTNS